MTIPENVLTYDQSPPHRPSINDLQYEPKANAVQYPPSDKKGPFAEEANQQALQIAALSNTSYIAVITVTITAGSGAVTGLSTVFGTPPLFVATRTGAGVVDVTTASALPPPQFPATACVIEDKAATINCVPITNGWRVKTSVAGTPTDTNFALKVA